MSDQRTKARLAVSEFQSASRAKLEAERDFTRAHDQLGKLLDDLIAESEGLRRLHYLENKAKDTTDSDIEEMNNLRRRLGLVTPMSTKPYRPISAAEGDFFIAAQCGNCTKQDGCRIVLLTMVRSEDDPKYPKEWVSDADGNNPRCTAREVTLATVLAEAIKENQELIANCGQNQIQGKVTT